MEFYIQMGHGMRAMCVELIKKWESGTVILSPVNIAPEKIIDVAKKIQKYNGETLLDPQLYLPRENHKNLICYDYWPKGNVTLIERGACDSIIKPLIDLNAKIGTTKLILPSFLGSQIDDTWNALQESIISCALRYVQRNPIFHTLALSKEVLSDDSQIENIISYVTNWNITGLYLACQHPEHTYLVENPVWISNLMALVSGLKRLNKKVILGYANHQMLCLGLCKCDAIASGNFLNTRWFKKDRFEVPDEDSTGRRALWYYSPQALSEYKIAYLDLAQGAHLLETLKPTIDMISEYSEMIFTTQKPTSSTYGESASQKHYIHSLKKQCEKIVKSSYRETLTNYLNMLTTAEKILSACNAKGIRCKERDFSPALDANNAAVQAHNDALGFVLENEWNTL